MYIAIDFDGTIVRHNYPKVDDYVPGAIDWMKKFNELGAKIILWTNRDDETQAFGVCDLKLAVDAVTSKGVDLFAVNENPDQVEWCKSPKVYADVYIDDLAFGCPLIYPEKGDPLSRAYVDWSVVGPKVYKRIKNFNDGKGVLYIPGREEEK
jgi:hypothetical protein